jgi:hypothetical protein
VGAWQPTTQRYTRIVARPHVNHCLTLTAFCSSDLCPIPQFCRIPYQPSRSFFYLFLISCFNCRPPCCARRWTKIRTFTVCLGQPTCSSFLFLIIMVQLQASLLCQALEDKHISTALHVFPNRFAHCFISFCNIMVQLQASLLCQAI